jgi:hypothetical protein
MVPLTNALRLTHRSAGVGERMTSWIITVVLAAVVSWIIFVEIKCGRRNKKSLAKVNEEIDALGRNATRAYRTKFGRNPTKPFIPVNNNGSVKVSSKRS